MVAYTALNLLCQWKPGRALHDQAKRILSWYANETGSQHSWQPATTVAATNYEHIV